MTGNSRVAERGSSAVEFSLVVAAMAAMIVGVVMGAGGIVGSFFDEGCRGLAAQVSSGSCPDPEADDATVHDQASDRSLGAFEITNRR